VAQPSRSKRLLVPALPHQCEGETRRSAARPPGPDDVDITVACVGARGLFEKAGFSHGADTDSVLNGFPRVLMRRDLS